MKHEKQICLAWFVLGNFRGTGASEGRRQSPGHCHSCGIGGIPQAQRLVEAWNGQREYKLVYI